MAVAVNQLSHVLGIRGPHKSNGENSTSYLMYLVLEYLIKGSGENSFIFSGSFIQQIGVLRWVSSRLLPWMRNHSRYFSQDVVHYSYCDSRFCLEVLESGPTSDWSECEYEVFSSFSSIFSSIYFFQSHPYWKTIYFCVYISFNISLIPRWSWRVTTTITNWTYLWLWQPTQVLLSGGGYGCAGGGYWPSNSWFFTTNY